VLYLAGSRDKVISRRNVEEILKELPATNVVTVDGPHLALYTNPEPAVSAIVAFINDAEASNGCGENSQGSDPYLP
jgi:hypothetical protein